MQELKQNFSEFVVCINNSDYPSSLELHKIYRVITDKEAENEGDIRIIDESGEDYNLRFLIFCSYSSSSNSWRIFA